VSAVVLNLTDTAPTTGPYLTANAGAGTRPTTTAASQRAGAPALTSCRTDGAPWATRFRAAAADPGLRDRVIQRAGPGRHVDENHGYQTPDE
jgi:hypothetical protein